MNITNIVKNVMNMGQPDILTSLERSPTSFRLINQARERHYTDEEISSSLRRGLERQIERWGQLPPSKLSQEYRAVGYSLEMATGYLTTLEGGLNAYSSKLESIEVFESADEDLM